MIAPLSRKIRWSLDKAIYDVRAQAEKHVRAGMVHIFLTDKNIGPERVPIPMILAVGAVHSHLSSVGLRSYSSINVETAECFEVNNFAVLIGVGATTINPWLIEETILAEQDKGLYGTKSAQESLQNYRKAVDAGLLKIISKMGISIISAYRGGYNFEVVGLSRALVAEFFPGLLSRISGLGLAGLFTKITRQHREAFDKELTTLPVGSFYKMRHLENDPHGWDGRLIHVMQEATMRNSYRIWKKYSEGISKLPPIFIRDLMGFKQESVTPAALEDVSSVTEIRKRFVAPGISLGAISPEAHETLAIAMNRIGARSDSGEGGEDVARYTPKANGDNACSAIKQVASGRFGVTAEYLNNCKEIEIKMAQGAKPGEGGQLPGHKVSSLIAKLRHSNEGVTLISPPPHHDIYSIEDLAQLIYDLKQINPEAEICVKLVARSGIGTVAAGVAKAHADTILISGHSGGTGASPQSSIKHAGLPWEIGLAEAHQVLVLNNLRHKIKLRTDGGLKTGRDIVIAAMLGAEEYGIGTASLVAMGCIMVRQCHSNVCPVGICTQDENLRQKFVGTPEKVINLMTFIAEEVREILASLGVRSLEEIIGRTDLLQQVSRGASDLDDLDFNAILFNMNDGLDRETQKRMCERTQRNSVPDTMDEAIIQHAQPFLQHKEKMELVYSIHNTDRSVGARLSSAIVRRYGMDTLEDGQLHLRFRGWAGQSFGTFAVKGLTLELSGEANDYVGKGLSGAILIIRPHTRRTELNTQENAIMGNTVLYGATSGKLYGAGTAGQRFCVRNSGAHAVIEGVSANGCEYMTGGEALILGKIGHNFAAGMTGGHAFIFNPNQDVHLYVNTETVHIAPMVDEYWHNHILAKINAHVELTHSKYAENIIYNWQEYKQQFVHIVPKEILGRLPHVISSLEDLLAAE